MIKHVKNSHQSNFTYRTTCLMSSQNIVLGQTTRSARSLNQDRHKIHVLHSPSALTHLWLKPQLFKHLHYLSSPRALTNLQHNPSSPLAPTLPQRHQHFRSDINTAAAALTLTLLHCHSGINTNAVAPTLPQQHQHQCRHQHCGRHRDPNIFCENAIKKC